MPELSKDDLALLRTIADWRDTATDEYYDIEGWREAAGERDRYADDPTRAWGGRQGRLREPVSAGETCKSVTEFTPVYKPPAATPRKLV